MSTLKSIIFETLPDDAAEEYWETAEALKDLDRQYQHFTRTVWKASKQLLKFDEINRLVAYEVEEKAEKASAGRASSGGSKTSSTKSASSSSGSGKDSGSKYNVPERGEDATLPLYFTVKDVLFNWSDLNWEQIMMKIIAGFAALGGAALGFLTMGPAGLVLGLALGLVFGCLLDNTIFNFDGELSPEEFRKSLTAILLPLLGAVGGFVAGGPVGAAIGLVLGTTLTLKVLGLSWSDVWEKLLEFFDDLTAHWEKRWDGFTDMVAQLWENLKNWWKNLSLGQFPFRLPHLTVSWEELSADSILARYLGISAIPHLGVEWYARGGIVDGTTLIGAGEQGREAIIPLERHTEWIRMVAVQLKEELEKLIPAAPQALSMLPAMASAMVPYAASAAPQVEMQAPDLTGLAATIAQAIAALGDRPQPEQQIRVYLDGRQLSDAVTRYQRRDSRANG